MVGNVTGDLTGDVVGNVTGNVTGDLTGDVTGNVTGSAESLTTGRTISLSGDASGTSAAFDGTSNVSILVSIADDSHNHTLSTITDAGTIASQNSNGVTITGGSISGITDLAVADGGTGASTALAARSNLGLAIGVDVPPHNAGDIIIHAGASPRAGTLVADGSNVSRTTYAALFAAIGTTWGAGDGSTTFTLPNLQDRHIEGAGTSSVGDYLDQSIQSHLHAVNPPSTLTSSDGAHTHPLRSSHTATSPTPYSDARMGLVDVTGGGLDRGGVLSGGSHQHTVDITEFDSGSTGGAVTRPPSAALLICIVY